MMTNKFGSSVWFISLTLLLQLTQAIEFDLSSIDGTNGFSLIGSSSVYSGASVRSAGDFNNDGYDDVIIGAPYSDSFAGAAYLLYGGEDIDIASMEVGDLDGNNGFIINGISANDYFGVSVSGAGDVNNDGYDDIIIGAYRTNDYSGSSYIIFGGKVEGKSFNVLDLTSSTGVVINGDNSYDYSGYSVSGAGDFNGDGFDDVIIGAYGYQSSSGQAYVIYGGTSIGTDGVVNLDATIDNSIALVITSSTTNTKVGYAVSGAGDMNNDGYDDVVIGSSSYNGACYVVFGGPTVANAYTNQIDDGIKGFKISSSYGGDYLGNSVSNLGDFNGDGYDDITIGASATSSAYIVFGGPFVGGSGVLYTNSLQSGSYGFQLSGESSSDQTGFSVNGIGDVDNDGYTDIIVGAPYATANGIVTTGKTYLFYGSSSNSRIYLSYLTNSETLGIVFNGGVSHELTGYSVSGAGDFNGDGTKDILIGACGYDDSSGITYLITDVSNDKNSNHDKNHNSFDNKYYYIISGCVFVLVVILCCQRCKKRKLERHSEKSNVDFNVIVDASEIISSEDMQASLMKEQDQTISPMMQGVKSTSSTSGAAEPDADIRYIQ